MRTTRSTNLDPEEMILYGLLFVIGAIPVVITLVRHATFGFDATIGLLMAAIGLVGMCAQLARLLGKRAA